MGPVGLGEVADKARKGKQERGRKKYIGDETKMRQRRSGLRERRGRTTEDVETGELRGGGHIFQGIPAHSSRYNGHSSLIHLFQSISEKAMVPHSSTLAWKILWIEEPGRL